MIANETTVHKRPIGHRTAFNKSDYVDIFCKQKDFEKKNSSYYRRVRKCNMPTSSSFYSMHN